MFFKRMLSTCEIVASKIVPAGVGWQGASILAATSGPATFAITTGMGDSFMVILGHQAWYRVKNKWTGSVDLDQEKQVSYWLGSAAFLSGTCWQPVVDVANEFVLGLYPTMAVTSIACGTAFYTGLRLFRRVYRVHHVPDSKRNDLQLAASIGGATGMFVCTDPILSGNHCVLSAFQISSNVPVHQACFTSGISTGLGFLALQSVQNAHVRYSYLDA